MTPERTEGRLSASSTRARTHALLGGAGPLVLPGATVFVSLVIVLAPWLGTYPVAAAALVWFVAVVLRVWRILLRSRLFTVPEWILAGATALAALRLSSLGLVQVLGERSTLFWNVDWRYAATQAWGIARFGDVSDSLDYAGEPVQYHVGPSWIAGALNHVAGVPVHGVLLIAMPAASVLVIVVCGQRLLRDLGASRTAAAVALTVLLSIPNSPYLLLRRVYGSFRGQSPLPEVLTDAEQWFFSVEIMQNSLFSIAVGLSAALLLVRRSSIVHPVLAALGFASLLAIKPQYAIGFLAVMGLGLLVTMRLDGKPGRLVVVVSGTFAVGAAATVRLNPSSISFTGVEFSLSGDVLRAFDPRGGLLGVAALVILALVLRPEWRSRHDRVLVSWSVGAVVGAVVLGLALGATTFLVDAGAVARANAVGLPYTVTSQDANLDQSLRPVMVVLVALAAALLVGHWQDGRVTTTRRITVVAALMAAATLPLTGAPLADPVGPAAYEVSEESDLAVLMAMTPEIKGRWLSNDLADPAQDFARPLRATSLTSFSPEQFYLSNVAYMGWTKPDVVQRVANIQRLFLTEWSPWHDEFVAEHDITHLVLRDRCTVAWEAGRAGAVVGVRGPWTLVSVAPVPSVNPTGSPEPPEASAVVLTPPRYGLSACLDGTGPLP